MNRPFVRFLVLWFAVTCLAQSTSWVREDKTDPLRGNSFSEFSVVGKFLTPPKLPTNDPPVFLVKCMPGGHRRVSGGYLNGKLLDAYIVVRTVVEHAGRGKAFVHYRLDDGKMHNEDWGVGTDGTAIFLPEIELNTVLYGHFMTHKDGTNPPTRKLVLGVAEYVGAEVVVQFDLPDPTDMADSCGLLIRKK